MKRNNFSLDSNNGFESDISEEAQEKTNSDCGRKRVRTLRVIIFIYVNLMTRYQGEIT